MFYRFSYFVSVFARVLTYFFSMMRTHDKLPHDKIPGVVYTIPCNDCNLVYCGETSKTLQTRLQQHKMNKGSGEINDHTRATKHKMNFEGAEVASREHKGGAGGPRWAMESVVTMIHSPNHMNDESKCMPMSRVFKQLFPWYVWSIILKHYFRLTNRPDEVL